MIVKVIAAVLMIIIILAAGYVIMLYRNMKKVKRMKLNYTNYGSKQFTVKDNIIYKKVENKNLLMDIYIPELNKQREKIPVVMFVHGEGVEIFIKDAKDWKIYTSYGKLLASRGYAAVTFNHRYAAGNYRNLRVASEDVTDAFKLINSMSGQYNFDMNSVFVWSFSLGGIYSSLFLKDLYPVKGVISYYGLLDLSTRVSAGLLQGMEEFTPDNYLQGIGNKNILVVKAAKDKIKGVNQSIDNFIKAAEKYQVTYEYIVHESGGHSFDILLDNEETKKVIEKTLSFIDKHSNMKE